MEKNIAYPTDARLYERAQAQLTALDQEARVDLRQTYTRLAPHLAVQVGRYAHAKQFRRMRKALRTLKGYSGRVLRDLRRQLGDIPSGSSRDQVAAKLGLVSQLLHQASKGGDKIHALHEPEVGCISKGKARVRYEFGCKVSIATTLDAGFVVGMRSFTGSLYNGNTPGPALEPVEILTYPRPELAVIDRGYRGHGVEPTRVLISGTRRSLTPKLIADLRRCSAIEPEIDHMKIDGRLARCPLKDTFGDALFAVLGGCGHNIRKILVHLRALLSFVMTLIRAALRPHHSHPNQSTAA